MSNKDLELKSSNAKTNYRKDDLKDEYDKTHFSKKSNSKGKKARNIRRRNSNQSANDRVNDPTTEKVRGNINDSSYYFSNPDLLAQVTNIAFNEYLGVPINFDSAYPSAKIVETVTNMCTFYMNPSVQPTGYAEEARYASINVIGFKNFLLLSANNAKSTVYAPQDVTCLILAIGQVLAMYSFLRRPFGCIYLINQRNRSYPELLFRSMGIDYSDFRDHVADYRIRFNQLIAMFDRIPFFSDVPYFDKCIKMFDFIYVDEDTPLAQTYLFVPQTTWTINEAYDPQGTGLVTTEVVSKGATKTFGQYLNVFADMINALATSSTFNAIFSDVLRVVSGGKGKVLSIDIISEAYSITPVINEEIRHWINNAKFVHTPDDKDAFPGELGVGATNYNDVASLAEQNGILYNPIMCPFGEDHNASDQFDTPITQAKLATYENDLVNFDGMNPSIEDRISATRLAVRGHLKKTASTVANKYWFTYDKIALGDYYCSGMAIYDDVASDAVILDDNLLLIATTATTIARTAVGVDKISKLKYAPRFHMNAASSEFVANYNYNVGIVGDLSYYTLLDWKYMCRMKDVEALTIFSINV